MGSWPSCQDEWKGGDENPKIHIPGEAASKGKPEDGLTERGSEEPSTRKASTDVRKSGH